ncbi:hypothetical protein ABKN59_011723 [Abortiporus biennis]
MVLMSFRLPFLSGDTPNVILHSTTTTAPSNMSSNREPLWYCHECNAEMRPLMAPDPHCASCNSTFVEKMENPADDPREFQHGHGGVEDDADMDQFFAGLQHILGMNQQARTRSPDHPPTVPNATQPRSASPPSQPGLPVSSGTYTIRIDRSTNGGPARTIITSGPSVLGGDPSIPRLSEFASRTPRPTRPADTIAGPLMLQYLLTMLANRPGTNGQAPPDFLQGMFPGAENGRMGDYVFNQEALDQIITQLMESSQPHPVPATEEIMNKLPREVLEEGSPLLEKDCAVCKDQFSLTTEDPDEQVIVTLPCKHPFHEPCIMPWLKSSATCPVCRYELVPQPHHHDPNDSHTASSNANGAANQAQRSSSPTSRDHTEHQGGGIFSNFFNFMTGAHGQDHDHDATSSNEGHASPSSAGRSQSPAQTSPRPSESHSRRGSQDHPQAPGAWEHDLD